jgi:DNA replication and repair protein RecF
VKTVEKVRLVNFRNLSDQIISFQPSINCIFGDNGNGKTNILEGIYISINKKSFRKKAAFQQILSVDCEKPEIITNITINKDEDEIDYYSVNWNRESFTCFKNSNEKIRKPNIDCVFVSPFDSFNFHNDSSFRRNIVDSFISKLSKEYKKTLSDYVKTLKQKNHLLKYSRDEKQLDALDSVLSKKIEVINKYRVIFVNNINKYLESTYREIFSEDVKLRLDISSVFNRLTAAECLIKLKESRKSDIEARYSKIGPNRDEVILRFNGFDSVEFCSLGQQKTAYLSLLFAYINLFGYKTKVFPVVLIDDVSGELDSIRLDLLIKHLFNASYQVVLTTANEDFKNKLKVFGNINLINVKDGYFH